MSKIFLFTLLVPLLNFLAIFVKKEEGQVSQKFTFLLTKFSAIICAILLCILLRDVNNSALNSIDLVNNFVANQANIKYLSLLVLTWFLMTLYFERLQNKQCTVFLPFFIFCLFVIILSNNLISMYFGIFLLTMLSAFILQKKLTLKLSKSLKLLIFALFSELVLFFLFTGLVQNFGNEVAFAKNGLIINLSTFKTAILLLIFLASIFLSLPFFLIGYKNFNFSSQENYLVLPLFLGVTKLFVLSKVVIQIFGIGLFSSIFFALPFELFFASMVLFTLVMALFCRDLRQLFFWIFFNQLSFVFLKILVIFKSDQEFSYAIILNFFLATSLVFMLLENLILFLKNAKNKEISGIFYDFKLNFCLLIFIFLNFASILPPFCLENLFLLKITFKNHLFISFLAVIFNSVGLFLLISKLSYVAFDKGFKRKEVDSNLAKRIDFSSQLSLTALLIAIIMIAIPFF
jgi:formate hydrogenlyase subunit 3/multisubunit Na+/H+ antiporter MnhD subunit